MQTESTLYRKGFGLKKEVKGEINGHYHSQLIAFMMSNNSQLEVDDTQICLAKDFGFCYGVDRAVEYSYQTRLKFPDRKIFLVGEIIHNPYVNRQIVEMGIEILDGLSQDKMNFEFINPEDVVLLPAFGVQFETLQHLRKRNCILVDTTCGSVLSVWKRVEQYARDGFTAIVHGKVHHEETRATCSQVRKYEQGKFVVVFDKSEAQFLCDFIEEKVSSDDLMEKLGRTSSSDFDPDVDLQRVGCANQTTMLSSESLEIAGMIERSFVRRYGEEEAQARFRSFDTICSATQDRQDAIIELLEQKTLDLILVIGGFNSSNTGHLVEIASKRVPAYHIEGGESLISPLEIKHKPPFKNETALTQNWLPDGPANIGMTSGASTPNSKVGEVLYRLLDFRGIPDSKVNSIIRVDEGKIETE